MSIASLLVPNDYDLYCGSITPINGGGNTFTPSSVDTLTNKTIDSGDNTIIISTTGDNINDIIDQRVSTLSNVNFLDVTTVGSITAGGAGHFLQVLTNAVNDHTLGNTCLINGVNPLTTANDLSAHEASSIAHGTTSNIVGVDDSQLLTNKTLDTAANLIQITSSPLSSVDINTLINQSVTDSSIPTFLGLNLSGGINEFGGGITTLAGTITIAPPGTAVTVYSLPTTSNSTYITEFVVVGFCTASSVIGNAGKGLFQRALNGIANNAGTLTLNIAFGNSFALNSIAAGQGVVVSGTNANHTLMATANDTIRWNWYLKIYNNQ